MCFTTLRIIEGKHMPRTTYQRADADPRQLRHEHIRIYVKAENTAHWW